MEFEHVKPMDIEKRSMEIIGQELAEMGISLPVRGLMADTPCSLTPVFSLATSVRSKSDFLAACSW